jgi:hypothetical protein
MTIDSCGATVYEFAVAGKKIATGAAKTHGTSATEETGATPVQQDQEAVAAKESARSFLQAARRNLTEEEASSPAGIRWLTHDVERLDHECSELREQMDDLQARYDVLKEQYNDKRVELETIKGATRTSVRNEALTYLCLSVGSAGLGACPGYLSVQGATSLATIGIVISGLLVLGGIVLRMWK